MSSILKRPGRRRMQSTMFNPLDRFFGNDLFDIWNSGVETVPSLNIREEKDNYKIELAAPGLKKDDFNINLEGNVLTISSEKESESKEGGESEGYSRREYNYSSFSRSLTLPENADPEKVTAKYTDGILNLTIPKKAGTQKDNGKSIKVE